MTESPIFSKTFDLLVWLTPVLTKFPKDQRFRLAARIDNSAFAFHEQLLLATRASDRRAVLTQADLELEKLRYYLRLAQAVKCLSFPQYEQATRLVNEIGKLLGGWLKTTPSVASTAESNSADQRRERPSGRLLEQ